MPKTLVVNLFAGPGAGKSTTAARVFAALKDKNINCELVTEYAKTRVWKEDFFTLNDQIYVFAKQRHKFMYLMDKVDVIVTDSPILLSIIYKHDETSEEFKSLVRLEHRKMNTLNVRLERTKPYHARGRLENKEQAKSIDSFIKNAIKFFDLVATGDKKGADEIIEAVLKRMYIGDCTDES